MVCWGTLWAVKMMGTRVPASSQARFHPAASFSAKALISSGWSCQLSTKSTSNGAVPVSPSSASRYNPTLVREFCGARQIATTRVMPARCISATTSPTSGRQLRMPTYTGSFSSRASSSPCFSVMRVSGDAPIKP